MNSKLGGGNNGNLGFVLTPQEFTHIHAAYYVWIQQPTTLNVPQRTPQHAASRILYEYVHEWRQRKESINIEKSLIKKTVKAIETKY